MVVHTCNFITKERRLRQEDHEFEQCGLHIGELVSNKNKNKNRGWGMPSSSVRALV
jgi:hypothetical protein